MKEKRVTLRKYGSGKNAAYFCDRDCWQAFREDRKSGLIYGPYYLSSLGRYAWDAEEYSREMKVCPYCNTKDGAPV